jgi:hypothetical protein
MKPLRTLTRIAIRADFESCTGLDDATSEMHVNGLKEVDSWRDLSADEKAGYVMAA